MNITPDEALRLLDRQAAAASEQDAGNIGREAGETVRRNGKVTMRDNAQMFGRAASCTWAGASASARDGADFDREGSRRRRGVCVCVCVCVCVDMCMSI